MKTNLSTFPENIRSLASWQIDVINWKTNFEADLRLLLLAEINLSPDFQKTSVQILKEILGE